MSAAKHPTLPRLARQVARRQRRSWWSSVVFVVDQVDRTHWRGRGPANTLRDNSAADLLGGLGAGRAAPVLTGVARLAVGRFVADLTEMDAAIAGGGLAAAADMLLSRYAGTVTIRGAGRVPPSGPLVVVANHAGTVDVLALWRLLAARDDLRIIALDRQLLRVLPHLASRLLFVEGDAHERTGLVRRVAGHLRSGGAVLTYPAGKIEPDPMLRLGDALASLSTWGNGAELLARLVPGTAVLPVAVSGVISQRMLRNPLARWRATAPGREWAAATLQMLVNDRSINPILSAGEPLRGTLGPEELRSAMVGLLHDCVSR